VAEQDVDLIAAGHDGGDCYPGVAAHLTACGPCGDDFAGLLAAVTGEQPEAQVLQAPGLTGQVRLLERRTLIALMLCLVRLARRICAAL